MKKNVCFLLRSACFLLILLALVRFGNQFLIQQDTIAYLTMEEIHFLRELGQYSFLPVARKMSDMSTL